MILIIKNKWRRDKIVYVDWHVTLCLQDHSRFVNALKYSPNGEMFVSGGAEGKVSKWLTLPINVTF